MHGKTIELDEEPGFPDGQAVSVALIAESAHSGDGLRKSFGSWASDAADLDEFLQEVRRDRIKRKSPNS
ncbi:MAG TPA: hypothetical protein VMD30_03035 [Tepidisphaeraceae bacterium]|nr:hypothetical protein [Tepidisphaeraceae bacterium]